MENIYQYALRRVREGGKYYINLKHRTMSVDGKYVIIDGEYENNLGLGFDDIIESKDVLIEAERLYERYKHSRPSERSDSRYRTHFKALKEEDLSDEDMMYGMPREEAMFELEFFLLAAILEGALHWNLYWGNWFWQSEKDKDFVILREWIQGV